MLAFLLIACVGRGHHELVVMQLDATRAALSAQQVQTREELAACELGASALREEIHTRQAQLDLLDAEHTAHEAELATVRERYAALVAEQAAIEATPPPEPPKKGPRAPKVPLPPIAPQRPVLEASVDEIVAALALASDAKQTAARADARHARIADAFAPLVAEGFATVERRGDKTVIVLLAAKLFNEGTVTLSPRGENIAAKTAVAMGYLHGLDMELQGHTDVTPFHSPELASNWELGFARGIAFLRALRDLGVDESAHVASYADTAPRSTSDSPEANREDARVELWLSEMPGIAKAFAPSPPPQAPVPAPGEVAPAP